MCLYLYKTVTLSTVPLPVMMHCCIVIAIYQKEFGDTKEVIRIRKSKKDRQHDGQKKKYERTNNDLQNIHIKLNKDQVTRTPLKTD